MTPLISIIVPVYNVEKFLSRCLESLIKQTFTNIEILLIDDGSTDKSPDICDKYAQQDNRIKVIHKENGGHASARNCGIDLANAQYIMFVDSDDVVHSDYCRIMFDSISTNPSDWVFCNMERVDENDEIISAVNEHSINSLLFDKPTYFKAFKCSLSGSVSNKIYSLDVIKKKNIKFDTQYKLGEDVQFDISYYNTCIGISFVPNVLYFYRVVGNSLTHSYHAEHLEIYIKLFSKRLPLIKENEIADFCDIYFHYFVTLLDNTMDKRNPMSFLQKMRYNDKMMKTEEFRYCVAHASGKNDSAIFMHVVRMHNYYIYWLFQKICKLKEKFKRKPKKY